MRAWVVLLLLLPCVSIEAWQATSRRDALRIVVDSSSIVVVGERTAPAHAVTAPTTATPLARPPRVLREPLLSVILTDDLGGLAVNVLAQTVQQTTSSNKPKSLDVISAEIRAQAAVLRDKASRSFGAVTPWQQASVCDEYYLSLSAYALWRTAAVVLPHYPDRDVFVRNLGRAVYRHLQAQGLVDTTPDNSLVASMTAVRQVLDVLVKSNFITSYRLGPDQPPNSNKNKKTKSELQPVVDELDDQALAAGDTVDLLLTVLEPATLSAALQITAEASRFAPDWVGPTLAAVWEDQAGLRCSWEAFFVDAVYRPRDYVPTEQLYQYTLQKEKVS